MRKSDNQYLTEYLTDPGNPRPDAVAEWFKTFITRYRERVAAAGPPTEKPNYKDFGQPVQISCILLSPPETSLVIATKWPDGADCEIKVYPAAPVHIATIAIEDFLCESRWNRPCPDERDARTWRHVLTETLAQFLCDAPWSPVRRPTAPLWFEADLLPERGFLWKVGDWLTSQPADIAAEALFDEHKWFGLWLPTGWRLPSSYPSRPATAPPGQTYKRLYGTHVLPPFWVGDLPEYSLSETVRRFAPRVCMTPVWKSDGPGLRTVYRNGFVVVDVHSREKAAEVLNLVSCGLLLSGFDSFSVRAYDVGEYIVGTEDDVIYEGSGSMFAPFPEDVGVGGSPRRGLQPTWHWVSPRTVEQRFRRVTKEEVQRTFDAAVEVAPKLDPGMSAQLVEACTHRFYGANTESFLNSWFVIERWYSGRWRQWLDSQGVTKKRIERLTEGPDWSFSLSLEALNLAKQMDDEPYRRINRLRKKRNKVIHEGEPVSSKEAGECFEVALEIVLGSVA